jgi:hypothetical protein
VLRLFETVTDLKAGVESIRQRRYGVIEAREGQFQRVRLRPYPKIASVPEVFWLGGWYHHLVPGDRCWLCYNQPRRFPNYVAVMSIVSARDTSLATIRRVLQTLDEIARIKGSDALLCDAANWRLSTAIMCHWGWEPHCPSYWHRHFIRRFTVDTPPVGTLPAISMNTTREHPVGV